MNQQQPNHHLSTNSNWGLQEATISKQRIRSTTALYLHNSYNFFKFQYIAYEHNVYTSFRSVLVFFI